MKKFIMGLIVGAILFSIMPVKAAIEEFICYRADYRVMIKGVEYTSPDLPILNYKGSTYGPLKPMLEAAGLSVAWNAELGQAEVSAPEQTTDEAITVPATNEVKYTPDGIKAKLLNGEWYIDIIYPIQKWLNEHKTNNTQTYYSLNPLTVKGEEYWENAQLIKINCVLSGGTYWPMRDKNEIIIDNIPLYGNTGSYIKYDYYVNTILPLIK